MGCKSKHHPFGGDFPSPEEYRLMASIRPWDDMNYVRPEHWDIIGDALKEFFPGYMIDVSYTIGYQFDAMMVSAYHCNRERWRAMCAMIKVACDATE